MGTVKKIMVSSLGEEDRTSSNETKGKMKELPSFLNSEAVTQEEGTKKQ